MHVVLREVAKNIFLFRVPVPVSVEEVNLYLFAGEEPALLDTGTNLPGTVEYVHQAMELAGIKELSRVLLTHWHVDHAGSAAALAAEGAEVLITARDWQEWQTFGQDLGMAAIKQKFYRGWGVPEEEIPGMLEIYRRMVKLTTPPPKVNFLLPGQKVRAGDYWLRVVPTPGHTPGHLAFYEEEQGLLFAGDQLLPDQIPYPGAWMEGDGVVSGLPAYLDSLAVIEELGAREYFPAHGQPQRDPAARCAEVRETIHSQVKEFVPAATVYEAACRLSKGRPHPGALFMHLHYAFGWENMASRVSLPGFETGHPGPAKAERL